MLPSTNPQLSAISRFRKAIEHPMCHRIKFCKRLDLLCFRSCPSQSEEQKSALGDLCRDFYILDMSAIRNLGVVAQLIGELSNIEADRY